MERDASRPPPRSCVAILAMTGGEEVAAFLPPVVALAPERAVDGDFRCVTRVDRVDDLGVVDALEVDRGDAEVGVADLALDDDQRAARASGR
jgi:hypothetical protein